MPHERRPNTRAHPLGAVKKIASKCLSLSNTHTHTHIYTQNVREWARRFSYAAALPVQPLFTRETPRGLELIFRKKPTKERGGEDGGLRIEVIVDSATWDSHRWPGATRGTGDDSRSRSPEVGRKGGAEAEDAPRCTLVVSRIAEGQDISKVFSEKIIVNKLVDGAKELGQDVAKVISLVKNTDIRPA